MTGWGSLSRPYMKGEWSYKVDGSRLFMSLWETVRTTSHMRSQNINGSLGKYLSFASNPSAAIHVLCACAPVIRYNSCSILKCDMLEYNCTVFNPNRESSASYIGQGALAWCGFPITL